MSRKSNRAAAVVVAESIAAEHAASAIETAAAVETTQPVVEAAQPVAKAPTKKQRTIDALMVGTTLAALSETLGVSLTAARSLIGDVRAAGITVASARDKETGVYTFCIPGAVRAEPAAEAAPEVAATE